MRIFAVSLILALSACSKGPETSTQAIQITAPTAQTLVHVEATSSLTAAIDLADHAGLSCADLAQCPSAVGMLLAADSAGGFDPASDSIAACTAVLVGDDLVLTNSHCIPSAVKLLPDLCSSRVRMAFAGTESLPAETYSCGQLVGFSQLETPMSPDLALLRLARKTGRLPFIATRSGVEPDSPLRSFRVNPTLKKRSGQLVSEVCRAVAGSFRMPVYKSAADSVTVLGDCNAIPGNSGSPLVNADGHLAALMQATLPLSPASVELWGKHSSEPFAPLSMGTSLRCLTADPASGVFAWDNDCQPILDDDVIAARPTIGSLIGEEPLAQETAGLLAPFFGQSGQVKLERQTLSSSALDRLETLRPACVAAGPEGPVNLQLPKISFSLRFNRYLQLLAPQVSVDGVATQAYEITFGEGGATLTAGQDEAVTVPVCEAARN